MRGVISAGMVSGLEDLGLTTAFDAVYGSSAGAINAAYFLAGQASVGTTIYFEDINRRRFISRLWPFMDRPMMNLTFLIEDVMTHRKPLDADRVIASPSPLSVLATDVISGSAKVLNGFTGRDDLLSALRASSTMPIIAGGPWVHRNRRYLDASLSEPIPVRAAEDAGATHVLVLLTRPAQMPWHTSPIDRWYVAPRLRRWSPDLADQYLNRGDPYIELLASIEAGKGPSDRADVFGLRAPGLIVNRLERDAGRLRESAARGRDAVLDAFR